MDDLTVVLGKEHQLLFDQRLHVLNDPCQVVLRNGGIESPIAVGKLLELLLPVLW